MSQPFLLLSCAISSLLSHFAGWHLGENPKPFHHHLSHRKCVFPQWGVKPPFCRKYHLLEVGEIVVWCEYVECKENKGVQWCPDAYLQVFL